MLKQHTVTTKTSVTSLLLTGAAIIVAHLRTSTGQKTFRKKCYPYHRGLSLNSFPQNLARGHEQRENKYPVQNIKGMFGKVYRYPGYFRW